MEIADIEAAARALNQDFIEKRLDGFPLGFLHVKSCQIGESSRHHVPRRDGFLSIQIGRWGAKRVDAQRQSFAAERRPNPDLAPVEQLLGPCDDAVFFLEFAHVNPEGEPRQVALRVDNERGNAGERSFLNERFRHHGLSRTG